MRVLNQGSGNTQGEEGKFQGILRGLMRRSQIWVLKEESKMTLKF